MCLSVCMWCFWQDIWHNSALFQWSSYTYAMPDQDAPSRGVTIPFHPASVPNSNLAGAHYLKREQLFGPNLNAMWKLLYRKWYQGSKKRKMLQKKTILALIQQYIYYSTMYYHNNSTTYNEVLYTSNSSTLLNTYSNDKMNCPSPNRQYEVSVQR